MLSQKNAQKALESFFNPKSIAVIGASSSKEKIGGFIFCELVKMKTASIYPINVKSNNIQNHKAFPNITSLEKKVDLAIVVIPGTFVLQTVEEIAKTHCKNILIISAGFKETGEEGIIREQKLKKLINKYSLNVIGPNCLGILNTKNNMNASFARSCPLKGGIGFVSQSGAVIDAVLDWSYEENVGFSKVVSIGNMAGVDELDMLSYFEKDPETKTICYYMETLEKGYEFAKKMKQVTLTKPVIIIKPGNSAQAQKAIGSHTGSLAQNSELVHTLLKENGAILVNNYEELTTLLTGINMHKPKGKKVAIVTNAGGPGVITSDLLSETKLDICELSPKLQKKLQLVLPLEASVKNPIDILGDGRSDRYSKVLKELVKSKEVDIVLVLLTPQIMTDSSQIAKEIISLHKKSSKTIVPVFLGGRDIKEAKELFHSENIAFFDQLNQAVTSISQYYTFNQNKKTTKTSLKINGPVAHLNSQIKQHKGLLPFSLTKKIVKCLGIDLPKKYIYDSEEEIMKALLKQNQKYVLKAEGIIHKKEEHAVVLGVQKNNFEDIALELFTRLKKKNPQVQLTLEEEVKGHEAFIGLKQGGDLGNFIFFGTGGSYISAYKDIAVATAPTTREDVKTLVSKTKINTILEGIRGEKSINYNVLYDLLIRISFLFEYFPQIKEVDFNPVICNENGVYCVDVKLLV